MNDNEAIRLGDIENQQHAGILTFPSDVVFKPNLPEGKREGKVEVLSKDGMCLAVLNYENNKLNGLCKLYENGELKMEVAFVNDKKEGWSREGDKEFIYHNNKKEFEVVKNEKLEGYLSEINIQTGKLNRCYKMNKNHKPIGVGYVFKDGEVSSVVNYKEESELIVIKEFTDGKMFERDESGNVIYEGEYLKDDCLKFPRHGNGKEKINDKMYIGNWNNNHKEGEGKLLMNGHLHYKGMWKNDTANGKGCLYDGEDNVVCEGEWKEGVCEKEGKEYILCRLGNNEGNENSKRLSAKIINPKPTVRQRVL